MCCLSLAVESSHIVYTNPPAEERSDFAHINHFYLHRVPLYVYSNV